jgi:hypothetical protein
MRHAYSLVGPKQDVVCLLLLTLAEVRVRHACHGVPQVGKVDLSVCVLVGQVSQGPRYSFAFRVLLPARSYESKDRISARDRLCILSSTLQL